MGKLGAKAKCWELQRTPLTQTNGSGWDELFDFVDFECGSSFLSDDLIVSIFFSSYNDINISPALQ